MLLNKIIHNATLTFVFAFFGVGGTVSSLFCVAVR